jgi:hypothetical protein
MVERPGGAESLQKDTIGDRFGLIVCPGPDQCGHLNDAFDLLGANATPRFIGRP